MNPPTFIDEDFLLQTEAARSLYHDYAEGMPIIDYHNHLPPEEMAGDRTFENMTQLWLAGDHYKWRALRAQGVDERYITGDASDEEKFCKWAETVPATLCNPLYHWTHMELKKPFGISELLNTDTASEIWTRCNEGLAEPGFSTRGLLKSWDVKVVCTTDDPVDDLEHHRALAAEEGLDLRMFPAFRPDKGLAIEQVDAFNTWIDQLAQAAGRDVQSFDDYLDALSQRCDYFHENGCRLSDHGLGEPCGEAFTEQEARRLFGKARGRQALDAGEARMFRSAALYHLGAMYHERGWTQQFHLGALRGVNTRGVAEVGSDSGYDSIGDWPMAESLGRQLDRLEREQKLPKTILYNLNPRDNDLMATMTGNFQDGSVPGKVQYGSGWWFLDQKDGMEKQLTSLANMGLLSRFVGMLTDSRSFLSFSRHEYFRRILCNKLGGEIEQGLLPRDLGLVGGMVKDICYHNAENYFGFPAA